MSYFNEFIINVYGSPEKWKETLKSFNISDESVNNALRELNNSIEDAQLAVSDQISDEYSSRLEKVRTRMVEAQTLINQFVNAARTFLKNDSLTNDEILTYFNNAKFGSMILSGSIDLLESKLNELGDTVTMSESEIKQSSKRLVEKIQNIPHINIDDELKDELNEVYKTYENQVKLMGEVTQLKNNIVSSLQDIISDIDIADVVNDPDRMVDDQMIVEVRKKVNIPNATLNSNTLINKNIREITYDELLKMLDESPYKTQFVDSLCMDIQNDLKQQLDDSITSTKLLTDLLNQANNKLASIQNDPKFNSDQDMIEDLSLQCTTYKDSLRKQEEKTEAIEYKLQQLQQTYDELEEKQAEYQEIVSELETIRGLIKGFNDSMQLPQRFDSSYEELMHLLHDYSALLSSVEFIKRDPDNPDMTETIRITAKEYEACERRLYQLMNDYKGQEKYLHELESFRTYMFNNLQLLTSEKINTADDAKDTLSYVVNEYNNQITELNTYRMTIQVLDDYLPNEQLTLYEKIGKYIIKDTENLHRQVETLTKNLEEIKGQTTILLDEIAQATLTILDYESFVQDIGSLYPKETSPELNVILHSLKSHIQKQYQDLQTKTKQHALLEDKHKILNDELTALRASELDIRTKLQQSLVNVQSESQALQTMQQQNTALIDEVNILRSNAETNNKHIDDVNQKLVECYKQVTEYNMKLSDKDNQLAKLHSQVENSTRYINELTQELTESVNEVAIVKGTLNKVESAVNQEKQEAYDTISDGLLKLESKTRELSDINTKYEQLKNAYTALSKKETDYMNTLSDETEKYKLKVEAFQALEIQHKQLDKTHKTLAEKYKTLNDSLNVIKNKYKEMERIEKAHEASLVEIQNLVSKVSELELQKQQCSMELTEESTKRQTAEDRIITLLTDLQAMKNQYSKELDDEASYIKVAEGKISALVNDLKNEADRRKSAEDRAEQVLRELQELKTEYSTELTEESQNRKAVEAKLLQELQDLRNKYSIDLNEESKNRKLAEDRSQELIKELQELKQCYENEMNNTQRSAEDRITDLLETLKIEKAKHARELLEENNLRQTAEQRIATLLSEIQERPTKDEYTELINKLNQLDVEYQKLLTRPTADQYNELTIKIKALDDQLSVSRPIEDLRNLEEQIRVLSQRPPIEEFQELRAKYEELNFRHMQERESDLNSKTRNLQTKIDELTLNVDQLKDAKSQLESKLRKSVAGEKLLTDKLEQFKQEYEKLNYIKSELETQIASIPAINESYTQTDISAITYEDIDAMIQSFYRVRANDFSDDRLKALAYMIGNLNEIIRNQRVKVYAANLASRHQSSAYSKMSKFQDTINPSVKLVFQDYEINLAVSYLIAQFNEKMEKLTKERDELNYDKQKVDDKLNAAKTDLFNNKIKLVALTEELKSLGADVTMFKSAYINIENPQSVIDYRRNELETLSRKYKGIQIELAKQKELVEALKQQLKHSKDLVQIKKKQLDSENNNITSFAAQANHAKLMLENEELRVTELGNVIAYHVGEINRLDQQISKINSRPKSPADMMQEEEFRLEKENLQSEIAQHQASIDEANRKIPLLKNKIEQDSAQLVNLQTNQEENKKEYTTTKAQYNSLMNELDNAKDKEGELHTLMEEYNRRYQSLNSDTMFTGKTPPTDLKIGKLLQEHAAILENNNKLLEELNKSNTVKTELETKVQQLNDTIKQQEKVNEQLNGNLKSLQDEVTQLAPDGISNSELKNQLIQNRAALEDAYSKINDYQNLIKTAVMSGQRIKRKRTDSSESVKRVRVDSELKDGQYDTITKKNAISMIDDYIYVDDGILVPINPPKISPAEALEINMYFEGRTAFGERIYTKLLGTVRQLKQKIQRMNPSPTNIYELMSAYTAALGALHNEIMFNRINKSTIIYRDEEIVFDKIFRELRETIVEFYPADDHSKIESMTEFLIREFPTSTAHDINVIRENLKLVTPIIPDALSQVIESCKNSYCSVDTLNKNLIQLASAEDRLNVTLQDTRDKMDIGTRLIKLIQKYKYNITPNMTDQNILEIFAVLGDSSNRLRRNAQGAIDKLMLSIEKYMKTAQDLLSVTYTPTYFPQNSVEDTRAIMQKSIERYTAFASHIDDNTIIDRRSTKKLKQTTTAIVSGLFQLLEYRNLIDKIIYKPQDLDVLYELKKVIEGITEYSQQMQEVAEYTKIHATESIFNDIYQINLAIIKLQETADQVHTYVDGTLHAHSLVNEYQFQRLQRLIPLILVDTTNRTYSIDEIISLLQDYIINSKSKSLTNEVSDILKLRAQLEERTNSLVNANNDIKLYRQELMSVSSTLSSLRESAARLPTLNNQKSYKVWSKTVQTMLNKLDSIIVKYK